MLNADLNYLAIFVAALGAWFTGALWYGVLGKHWLAALGKTREELPMSVTPMVLSFIGDLVIALVLAIFISLLTDGEPSIQASLLCALVLWAGFVLSTITVNNAYGGRRFALTIIDAGHWLAAMLVAGAILGTFG